MSSSLSLLPQQYLIALQNQHELIVALSRLSSLPPSLVCLCSTNRQCEWLKSLWPKGCGEKRVIFLSTQKLCQAGEWRRHLHRYKTFVWVLPFFELLKDGALYRELAEHVAQIWAMSWGMSIGEQRQWAQLARSSQLTPVLCSQAGFRWPFESLESIFLKLWQKEKTKEAAYRLALGEKHLLIYQTERELRFWRLWARRHEVTFSLDPFCPKALLGAIHVKGLVGLEPADLSQRSFLVCSQAWQAPETHYALGLSGISRSCSSFLSSLLRCAQWVGLVARRQFRWL